MYRTSRSTLSPCRHPVFAINCNPKLHLVAELYGENVWGGITPEGAVRGGSYGTHL